MPRYESFNDDYIVIKLKSGYNIGVLVENTICITNESPSETSANTLLKIPLNMKNRLIILSHQKKMIILLMNPLKLEHYQKFCFLVQGNYC